MVSTRRRRTYVNAGGDEMNGLFGSIVYGSSLIFSVTGRDSPKWLKIATVISGVAIVAVGIKQRFYAQAVDNGQQNELNGLAACCSKCEQNIRMRRP